MDKNERVLTVAIIGAGSRGADSYGKIMNKDPRFKIVSVCDKRQVKLDAVKERFKISDDNLFLDEKDFFAKKRADICIVATQDKDHVRHCIAALKAGYDVLLEITDGQMVGDEYNGTNYVRVRFDGGKVQKFYYNEPNDGSSNLVFLRNAQKFIEKCKNAKDIIIEQEFYQEGVHQFKFHVDEPLPKKLK